MRNNTRDFFFQFSRIIDKIPTRSGFHISDILQLNSNAESVADDSKIGIPSPSRPKTPNFSNLYNLSDYHQQLPHNAQSYYPLPYTTSFPYESDLIPAGNFNNGYSQYCADAASSSFYANHSLLPTTIPNRMWYSEGGGANNNGSYRKLFFRISIEEFI